MAKRYSKDQSERGKHTISKLEKLCRAYAEIALVEKKEHSGVSASLRRSRHKNADGKSYYSEFY